MPKRDLTTKEKRLLQLAKAQGNDKDLVFLELFESLDAELKEIRATLQTMAGKEIKFPDIPEPKETDLSPLIEAVNKNSELLEKILNKDEQWDVNLQFE